MTDEQINLCVAFILVIAFDGERTDPKTRSQIAKKVLAKLPPESVAKAAGTPIDFAVFQ